MYQYGELCYKMEIQKLGDYQMQINKNTMFASVMLCLSCISLKSMDDQNRKDNSKKRAIIQCLAFIPNQENVQRKQEEQKKKEEKLKKEQERQKKLPFPQKEIDQLFEKHEKNLKILTPKRLELERLVSRLKDELTSDIIKMAKEGLLNESLFQINQNLSNLFCEFVREAKSLGLKIKNEKLPFPSFGSTLKETFTSYLDALKEVHDNLIEYVLRMNKIFNMSGNDIVRAEDRRRFEARQKKEFSNQRPNDEIRRQERKRKLQELKEKRRQEYQEKLERFEPTANQIEEDIEREEEEEAINTRCPHCCQDLYNGKDGLMVLPCNHTYHKKCLIEGLNCIVCATEQNSLIPAYNAQQTLEQIYTTAQFIDILRAFGNDYNILIGKLIEISHAARDLKIADKAEKFLKNIITIEKLTTKDEEVKLQFALALFGHFKQFIIYYKHQFTQKIKELKGKKR